MPSVTNMAYSDLLSQNLNSNDQYYAPDDQTNNKKKSNWSSLSGTGGAPPSGANTSSPQAGTPSTGQLLGPGGYYTGAQPPGAASNNFGATLGPEGSGVDSRGFGPHGNVTYNTGAPGAPPSSGPSNSNQPSTPGSQDIYAQDQALYRQNYGSPNPPPSNSATGQLGFANSNFAPQYAQNPQTKSVYGDVWNNNPTQYATEQGAQNVADLISKNMGVPAQSQDYNPGGPYSSTAPMPIINGAGMNNPVNAGLAEDLFAKYGTAPDSYAYYVIGGNQGTPYGTWAAQHAK